MNKRQGLGELTDERGACVVAMTLRVQTERQCDVAAHGVLFAQE